MRVVKFLLAIVIGVSIVGCTTGGGTKVTQDQVSGIKKGVTTRAEVVSMLGQPDATSVADDGSETLTWSYSRITVVPIIGLWTGLDKMESSSFMVKLNKDRVVENYDLSQGVHKS